MLTELYQPPLALLTDLYQLTMAYGYWRHGLAEHLALFEGLVVAAIFDDAADVARRPEAGRGAVRPSERCNPHTGRMRHCSPLP